MSASLVGSEMCIRDRRSVPVPHWEAAEVGDPRFRRCAPGTPRFARRGACLLYTSDAADDM
eukprot:2569100-Alexandrium_andersonii.AAC.1